MPRSVPVEKRSGISFDIRHSLFDRAFSSRSQAGGFSWALRSRGCGAQAALQDFSKTFLPEVRLAEQVLGKDVAGSGGAELLFHFRALVLGKKDDGDIPARLGPVQLAQLHAA